MSTAFNVVDLAFIAFTLIFVATAFFRGFVKEIFALVGWLLAFVGSYLLTPYVSDFFNVYSHNKLVADISARCVIFLIIFLSYTFSTSGLSSELKERIPKAFDRSLGIFYGLVKTLIVFGFMYAVATNALGFLSGKTIDESASQFPAILKEAKCHDILKGSADVLNPAVKLFFDAVVKNFDQVIPKPKGELDEKIDEVVGGGSGAKRIVIQPEPESVQDLGYEKKDIEKMNHLIEIIGK